MKVKRKIIYICYFALILATSSCASCWQHPVDTGKRWFTEATLQEAIKERDNFINSYFKLCKNGDKEYRYAYFQPDRNTSTFVAFKNISWFWIGRKLSQADIENNIKFIADISLGYNNFSLVRQYSKEKGWSDASEMNSNFARSMKVTFRSGKWTYDSPYKPVPVSCAELISGGTELHKFLVTEADRDAEKQKLLQAETEKKEIEGAIAPIKQFIAENISKCADGRYFIFTPPFVSSPNNEYYLFDAGNVKISDLKYADVKDKKELKLEVSLENYQLYELRKKTVEKPTPSKDNSEENEDDNKNQNTSSNNINKSSGANLANKPLLFIRLNLVAFFFGINGGKSEQTFSFTIEKENDAWKITKKPDFEFIKRPCSEVSSFDKRLIE